MTLLVTGAAGFIGFYVSKMLAEKGHKVIGIDNLNHYYDQSLKKARLECLEEQENFSFECIDLIDLEKLQKLFKDNSFDCVVNLAAQAGVRYSLENPHAYIDSNVSGFMNVLECCRHNNIGHLVYASSSSVYGNNKEIPFTVDQRVDKQVSIYAATKRMNELMAHTYSHLYKLPTTGLRFFTVYGPWGRPDMAPFLFTKAILSGEKIKVFNNGDMLRDFTYVEDIAEGVVRVVEGSAPRQNLPYELHNIGNSKPIKLLDFIETIEKELGVVAEKEMLPMQDGDVYETYADTSSLEKAVGFKPKTTLDEGIAKFISWYKEYYKI